MYHLKNVCSRGVVFPSYLTATGRCEISFYELEDTGRLRQEQRLQDACKNEPGDPAAETSPASNENHGLEALAAYFSRSQKPHTARSGSKII